MATDAELRDQAVAYLKATTITYPAWEKAVRTGKYNPRDGSATRWGQALAALAQIDQTAPAPSIPVPALPVGPFQKFATSQWYRDVAHPTAVSKIEIDGATDYGLGLMDYWPPKLPPTTTSPFTISDVIAKGIGKVPPVSDGTAEAGAWFGAPVKVTRIAADGSWEGIWLGCTVSGSTIKDFTAAKLDPASGLWALPVPGVGVYPEHVTSKVLFDTGSVISSSNGFNWEWWYPDGTYANYVEYLLGPGAWSGKAGSWGCTLRNVAIYCPKNAVGSFEDAGTFGNTYDGCYFYGPGPGVGLPNNRLGPQSVILPNCVFANQGAKVYYHDNAIGVGVGLLAQPGRPLHPHTIRNSRIQG